MASSSAASQESFYGSNRIGQGRRLRARQLIPSGTFILQEGPDIHFAYDEPTTAEVVTRVAHLDVRQRARFESLPLPPGSLSDDSLSSASTHHARWTHNALVFADSENQLSSAIFRRLVFARHDDNLPNGKIFWNFANGKMVLRASRDIYEDEEITIDPAMLVPPLAGCTRRGLPAGRRGAIGGSAVSIGVTEPTEVEEGNNATSMDSEECAAQTQPGQNIVDTDETMGMDDSASSSTSRRLVQASRIIA
ncbi:MAG: hypothetical protein M1828_000246 [Chrysothrix sp. TS-e1954]|nr:MAG: hypothetical protein M1828_000246 [Chrysothrix sp. TS-e1954]